MVEFWYANEKKKYDFYSYASGDLVKKFYKNKNFINSQRFDELIDDLQEK